MMAQSRAESTRDTCNYGQYLNQFPQNTIKVIREFERIQKKICRHKMSIMFNEICINEEMLPIHTCIYSNPSHEYDATQGQFLSGVEHVLIPSFPSLRLVAIWRLKNPVCSIYPKLNGEELESCHSLV